MRRWLLVLAFVLAVAALIAAAEWAREKQHAAAQQCRQRFAAARTWDDSVQVWRTCP